MMRISPQPTRGTAFSGRRHVNLQINPSLQPGNLHPSCSRFYKDRSANPLTRPWQREGLTATLEQAASSVKRAIASLCTRRGEVQRCGTRKGPIRCRPLPTAVSSQSPIPRVSKTFPAGCYPRNDNVDFPAFHSPDT
ncbi:hypothetical protein MPH_08402 [Macrophomina phaseolina MS6]|uniref:Uncharacterized protein n=1 Tax=Macrophomina phaseolina (strain MS6) TaxID=1126212 RepID=K2RII3_MACPH|nr:hypothetical protein MPH_08402 [Macrophomina phaseolina MS6]